MFIIYKLSLTNNIINLLQKKLELRMLYVYTVQRKVFNNKLYQI